MISNNFNLDIYFGMDTIKATTSLYKNLTQKIFTVQDTGLSYQIVKFWDAQELLLTEKEGGKWRKFSFLDYLWLKTLDELRLLGMPVKILKEIKEGLFNTLSLADLFHAYAINSDLIESINLSSEEKEELKKIGQTKKYEQGQDLGFSYFLLLLTESISRKAPVSILVFSDGSWLPWIESRAQAYNKGAIEKKTFQTHVVVSLSNLLKSFLCDDKSLFVLPKLNILETPEIRILEIISSGDFQTVTVNFKNKKIKSVQMTKEQDVKKHVVDILSENAYQDITIKTHKGLITKIENTTKIVFE